MSAHLTPERARQTISELIALVGTSDLIDLEIADGDLQVRLHRAKGKASAQRDAQSDAVSAEQAALGPAARPAPRTVRSPLVGRFYHAREIDKDPLVREGDTIAPGQVVGMIEAMSLFSEVESEEGGRVIRILVDNGDRVEYGQPLVELD